MSLSKGLDGMGELAKKARDTQAKVIAAKKRGLAVAGFHVLGVSNAQAPIETGGMIRTGSVTQDDDGLTAISYDDAEYEGQAVQQHEDMSLNHDDGRNAKFLENALNSERDVVMQIVGTAMKQEAGLG